MPPSSSVEPITVNIGEPSLVKIISKLDQRLAKSGKRPLSISIVNRPRSEYDRLARRLTEGVAVQSVLCLLRMYFDRVEEFILYPELRSSLRGVSETLQEYGVLEKTAFDWDIDDVPTVSA